ncbi:hypothetical protein B4Q13_17870, partial [Lacticaseibacillus rhamnosus]
MLATGAGEVVGTGTLTSGILGVGSGQTATANAINITATDNTSAILRVAGNSAGSTLNVGAGGITASGGAIQGAKALGTKQYFSAGTDWHWVEGASQEDSYNAVPGPVTPPVQNAVLALKRNSGGTQRTA